jgi:hypothetical protein
MIQPHLLATHPATLANVTLNGQTVKLLNKMDNRAMIHEVKFCHEHEMASFPFSDSARYVERPALTPTTISAK